MERDEVILLKCFDTELDGRARWTAHAAFEDPNASRPIAASAGKHRGSALPFY